MKSIQTIVKTAIVANTVEVKLSYNGIYNFRGAVTDSVLKCPSLLLSPETD